jgi:hypothetical protein
LTARPEVEWAQFDLGEIRRLHRRLDPALLERLGRAPAPPRPPAGLSHREYGQRIQVPGVDLYAGVGSVHLWYLVESTDLLHHLLAELQLERWGELRSLIDHGGAQIEERVRARLEAACKATETAITKLRIGRGRKVDRGALVASGAVSDRFIDELDELRRRVEGDAAQMIALLEEKAVANFLRRNLDALRAYLESEGYLDARETLTPEVIRREVAAEMRPAIEAGRFTSSELDRLLSRLLMGAGYAPMPVRREVVQSQLWPEALA